MKTRAQLFLGALLLSIALGGRPGLVEAQASPDMYGGWIVAEWEWADGQDGPTPQRGLFLFTESGHYSIMFVIGDAREALVEEPTDADIAAAYNPFVANSGRYTVSGSTITYEAYVAKDPEYMSGFAPTGGDGNEQTMTFRMEDGALILTFGAGGPMGGATATLRRPGGGD
ncbi:MAG: lipocalin-like domain-containing protein [Gemmatimonadota bacterium]|nr:lipocalin-like domain-containing protein [Gemmatimonadota bacterium]